MKKEKLKIILVFLFIICCITTKINGANNESEDVAEELEISSRIALIYDRLSGNIVYEKNGNKQTPMASTTKIMTAIVVIENANLTDTVTVESKAASIGGSRLGLKKNDKITVNDLLYGLMLRSGNDAAIALAIHVGGSIEGFAEMMNSKAKELGLTNTNFVVPHGLDSDEHYTTAYELAKITDYALENETFKKIVSTTSTSIAINGNLKQITNTNKLLTSVSGVYGVKTGFTNGAGRCLVGAWTNDDIDIITVIIGADTSKIRTSDTKKLITYVKENYETIDIKEILDEEFESWKRINSGRIFVEKGVENSPKLLLEELGHEKMLIKKTEKDLIRVEVDVIYRLKAPVKEKQIIGMLKIFIDNKNIKTLEIYNEYEIKRKEIKDYLFEFIKNIKMSKFYYLN